MNKKFSLDFLIKTQIDISQKIIIKKIQRKPNLIAGVDVGIHDDLLCGFIAVMTFPTLEYIDGGYAVEKMNFPYIPGFLAFREIPVIINAYSKLKNKPDLIFVDGQGIAHPRFCGIAAHLGVLLNKPTIGCAKSYLFGDWRMPGKKRGDWTPIEYAHKIIGIVLRTRDNTKPLFVSPGNRASIDDCRKYVLTTAKYRIPEPIRCAHIKAREVLRKVKGVECLK
ncbi:MAG: endonuclease V [bacterium]